MRKYNVITNKGHSIKDLESLLLNDSNLDNIPDRRVAIFNSLSQSDRVTTFFLSDEEAEQLSDDYRVLAVDLDLSERPEVKPMPFGTMEHNWRRIGDPQSDAGNWGIRKHTLTSLDAWTGLYGQNVSSSDQKAHFNSAGQNVDIIIMDSGLDAAHPEFEYENGGSRVKKINWLDVYKEDNPTSTEYDLFYEYFAPDFYYKDQSATHGTAVASIAAGKRFGFAKNANIYLARLQLDTPFPSLSAIDWFNTIMYWHRNKANNNPTIVQASWGLGRDANLEYANVTGGFYKPSATANGNPWTRQADQTDEDIANNYKMRLGTFIREWDTAYQALIEEMTDSGIHFVSAAGNGSGRIVKPDNYEFDNRADLTYTYLGFNISLPNYYYNRPTSPYPENGLSVGAIDEYMDLSHTTESIKDYSEKGSGVDIYAATSCTAAFTSTGTFPSGTYTTFIYPEDSNFEVLTFTGTSCAAPQVTGVLACYLSVRPDLTPAQARQKILNDANTSELEENDVNDYYNDDTFLDSNNKVLYNRYNQENLVQLQGFGNYTVGSYCKPIKATFSATGAVDALDANNTNTFSVNNAETLFRNGKIISCMAYTASLHRHLVLKFDGDAFDGGFDQVQIADANGTYHLNRAEAVYDIVKKEFVWREQFSSSQMPSSLYGAITVNFL